MANKHYTMPSTATFISGVSSALQDKYGAGVTIHYIDSTNIIFSCPAIANKVIKVVLNSISTDHMPYFYYGDSWQSGKVITNQVQFAGKVNTAGFSPSDLILGDSFALFSILTTYTGLNSVVALVGKMTNEDFIVVGAAGTSSTTNSANSIGKNTTTGNNILPITMGGSFSSHSKLYKQPIIFANAVNGEAELNSDNSFATIAELYNISYQTSQTSVFIAANAFFSPCSLYMADGAMHVQTCLYAEF